MRYLHSQCTPTIDEDKHVPSLEERTGEPAQRLILVLLWEGAGS